MTEQPTETEQVDDEISELAEIFYDAVLDGTRGALELIDVIMNVTPSELIKLRERIEEDQAQLIEGSRCVDCGSLEDFFMVKDEVWAASGVGHDGGWLCVRDLERRIGRALTPDDFTDAPTNDLENRFDTSRSQLLQDRLEGR